MERKRKKKEQKNLVRIGLALRDFTTMFKNNGRDFIIRIRDCVGIGSLMHFCTL